LQILFTGVVTFVMHDYWNSQDQQTQHADTVHFWKVQILQHCWVALYLLHDHSALCSAAGRMRHYTHLLLCLGIASLLILVFASCVVVNCSCFCITLAMHFSSGEKNCAECHDDWGPADVHQPKSTAPEIKGQGCMSADNLLDQAAQAHCNCAKPCQGYKYCEVDSKEMYQHFEWSASKRMASNL
jgi:hypothetical protein